MTKKKWVFEVTIDTDDFNDEYGEELESKNSKEATDMIIEAMNIILHDGFQIDSDRIKLKTFEEDFSKNDVLSDEVFWW